MNAVSELRVGCCGFALAQRRYFDTFSCVEINSSFYQLPQPATAERWRTAAPPGFRFAMKAWQVVTHPASSPTYRRTRLPPGDREHCGFFGYNPTIRWAWDQTHAVARILEADLVLFQCPVSFRPTRAHLARFRAFFEKAKRGRFLLGWEPRGDWPPELVAGLCRELDLIHVVDPHRQQPALRQRRRYFRLHGISGGRHRFSEEELRRLQQVVTADRSPVWCVFNNVTMAADAQRFQRLAAPRSPVSRLGPRAVRARAAE